MTARPEALHLYKVSHRKTKGCRHPAEVGLEDWLSLVVEVGRRGRLGGTTYNKSQFIQGYDSASVLAKTSDDEESVHSSGWKAVFQCPSQ